MAESNPTQVILTDDGLKIIKAQNTADEVVGNINDINSDNKLTPSEKIKLKQEYDKDLKLYAIDVSQLQSAGLPTTELETAMSNLTAFVTPLFEDMHSTSNVDRNDLDGVFTAFATADKNASQAFVNMVQQVADDAKKAGDDAKETGEKAQEAGEEAKASANQAQADATQAKSDAATAQQKAQSSIDQLNAHLPDVNEALSTANLVKQDVTKLSNTTEQYHNEYTTGIQNVIKTVDDISIGGTNLLTGTGSHTVTGATTNGYLSNETTDNLLTLFKGLEGQTVTVSVDYEYSGFVAGSGRNRMGWEIAITADSVSWPGIWYYPNNDSGSGKVSSTFVVPKNITRINEGHGFIQFSGSGTGTLSHLKLEKGNKATDWSPAPEDLATSTEFDQLSNAIKLKADSADVTSQITVATQGVQSEVDNKVTDLNTKISQTSDAVQILASTAGSKNLVYNATFEQKGSDFPYGWIRGSNASNETGYTSNIPVSSYQGRCSIGVNTSKELGWVMFAQSDPQPLPVDNSVDAVNNVYSASMMVKVYRDNGAKDNGHVHVVLAFFDANKKRIENNIKGVWSQTAKESNEQWHMVKVENFAPSANAKYVAIQAFTYGTPTHAMINQPMINIGATVQPFKADVVNQAAITESINNINLKVANADGSSSQVNINNDSILLDANKIILNGNTSIQNGTIGTAKIANAAINTAQIADGAINNTKIANASINDAKINSLNGNKIIANSITANKINVDDLIANGINTKTLTSVNLNTSTLTTPQLNLGLNGTFNEDFDYTQPTSIFLPKKNKGTLTFNHGVLQSRGNMQTYVNGQWGGMNDNYTFQAGIDNSQWTEVAPGYIKLDLFKQNDTDVAERTYVDPTGFYYTTNSNQAYTSYVGNIVSTPQVQTSSVLTKYIGPSAGQNLLQIDNNGSDYGLQVGSYAGKEAVLSDYIYNFTASTASNVYITSNGHLARTTSASKYKYNISNPDYEDVLGDRLLNVHLASWNDKNAIDSYAHTLNTGEDTEKISIGKYHGLIAEQLRNAGLEMFVEYNEDGEIEGIQYDRAWIPLLAVVRRLNNRINEYEMRISKLEGKK
ncbi:hypothetical protein GBP18_07900 [Pediococcus acidilactici]|uniref:hypothetical protein n=1 Tax=Pediococcus acidilactici TaxID=1254 RepID=UPI0013305321|nr:hypothetical protein [Pediococcus acidilactici]KAF0489222.1 hypothetical protein GBP18_07900 [Pediococcus acidilactici]